ncbi:hypothetical protein [Streptomyces sp. NPDC127033]|uniref:hypothetical protein n=1 Tax=Streptomyces sp. NPDC127033 TaxID=3347110 RepID=UPI003651A96A
MRPGADDLGCTASTRLATAVGTVLAEIRGLRVSNVTPPTERFTARLSHQEWTPAPASEDRSRAVDGTWAVLADQDDTWPTELSLQLRKKTAGCRLLPLGTALADPPYWPRAPASSSPWARSGPGANPPKRPAH